MTFTDIVQDAAIAALAATSLVQTFTIRRLTRRTEIPAERDWHR